MDLVKSPFLLSLALEALPGVIKGKRKMSTIKITRVQLYDTFVQHWFEVNQRRLERNNALSSTDQDTLVQLVDAGFVSLGIDYSTKLAQAIFENQDGNPEVHYVQFSDTSEWKAGFFGGQPKARLLRGSSPLTRTGNFFRFMHRSMQEYFFSRIIYNPTKGDKDKEFSSQVETIPIVSQLLHTGNPLFQRILLHEPSVIDFLCGRVNLNPGFKDQLRAVIDLSKTDASAIIAATNAISILVKAGVTFNGADLRGIKISGADLSNGQFDSAQFQGADLREVNFAKSWLRQADMSNARMDGVKFGELPYLEMNSDVESCAYSPDGKMLGVGLFSGIIYIYDTLTWTKIHRLEGHGYPVTSIVFSPDSQRIVSSSCHEDTVRVWDTASGENVLVTMEHISSVNCVAISPCGLRIASASYKTVHVWNAQTGEMVFMLKGHKNHVNSVKYSPDGCQLVSSCFDRTIRFWDSGTGKRRRILDLHRKHMRHMSCISYSPDGRWVASGHEGGHLKLWDAFTLEPGPVLSGHTGNITAVDFSSDGRWMASSSDDKTAIVWDTSTSAPIAVLIGHCKKVRCITFSPDGREIASGGCDKKVRLWEAGSKWSNLNPRNSCRMENLAYSRDGRFIFSSYEDRIFYRLDTATDISTTIPYEVPEGLITSSAFALDGSQLALGCDDGSIRLWNCRTNAAGSILESEKCISRTESLLYSPCSRWLISVSWGNSVRLWGLHSVQPQPLFVDTGGLEKTALDIVFSSTGCQFLMSGFWARFICLFDTHSGECQSDVDLRDYIGDLQYITSSVFSPNGHQVAIAIHGGTIYLWDLRSKKLRVILVVYECPTPKIIYSPCGQWIALNSAFMTAGIWHCQLSDGVESWSKVYSINAFFNNIKRIACSPIALMEFVTSTFDGAVQVWRMSIDEGGRIVFKMVWGSNLRTLCAEGIVLTNAIGLSPLQQTLLTQRSVISSSKW